MRIFYPYILILLFACGQSETDALKKKLAKQNAKYKAVIKEQMEQIDSLIEISKDQSSTIKKLNSALNEKYSSDTSCFEDPNLKHIRILNHVFYHEVITGRAVPRVKKEYGVAKLMLDEFISGLSRKEIFDTVFLNEQRIRFKKCEVDIEHMQFEGETDLGWEPSSCDFFNFYYYVGSQELPQYYQTTDFKSDSKSASAKIRYFDVYEKQEHFWPKYLNMDYVNINGEWKIRSAELIED